MTIDPTIRGFPDYMYPNGAASAVLVQEAFVNQAAIELGPFDVSSWPITELIFFPSALGGGSTYVRVTYIWEAQSYSVGLQYTKQSHLTVNALLADICINRGSTLKIVVEALGPAGTFTGELVVIERSGLVNGLVSNGYMIRSGNVPLGVGGNTTQTATLVTPGPTNIMVFSDQSNFVAGVDLLTTGGTWSLFRLYQELAGGKQGVNDVIFAPSSQMRIRIINLAGVGANVQCMMVPQGF